MQYWRNRFNYCVLPNMSSFGFRFCCAPWSGCCATPPLPLSFYLVLLLPRHPLGLHPAWLKTKTFKCPAPSLQLQTPSSQKHATTWLTINWLAVPTAAAHQTARSGTVPMSPLLITSVTCIWRVYQIANLQTTLALSDRLPHQCQSFKLWTRVSFRPVQRGVFCNTVE